MAGNVARCAECANAMVPEIRRNIEHAWSLARQSSAKVWGYRRRYAVRTWLLLT
jgi:hypothetical protein